MIDEYIKALRAGEKEYKARLVRGDNLVQQPLHRPEYPCGILPETPRRPARERRVIGPSDRFNLCRGLVLNHRANGTCPNIDSNPFHNNKYTQFFSVSLVV